MKKLYLAEICKIKRMKMTYVAYIGILFSMIVSSVQLLGRTQDLTFEQLANMSIYNNVLLVLPFVYLLLVDISLIANMLKTRKKFIDYTCMLEPCYPCKSFSYGYSFNMDRVIFKYCFSIGWLDFELLGNGGYGYLQSYHFKHCFINLCFCRNSPDYFMVF